MDLSNFISETLVGIQKGVHDAIAKSKGEKLTGVINPVLPRKSELGYVRGSDLNQSHIEKVQFDIAVTVDESNSSGMDGSIKVMGISAGGDKGSTHSSATESRIQFSIPIIPPVTNVTGDDNSENK